MSSKAGVDLRADRWTYGAEHELADWDTSLGFHPGCYRTPDVTIVNSNGVAAQTDLGLYRYGGELNTPPTHSPEGQAAVLACCLDRYGCCAVNHRSNLHVHVRVPGLRDSLPHLKAVQRYVDEQLPLVIDLLEPIPEGRTPAERKRERRRRVSHHTFLPGARVKAQLAARTTTEFFEAEVPRSRAGKPLWHAQPRACVNLRQLLQTDTVEFRHFPGTLDPAELTTCVGWCRDFLLASLVGDPIGPLWHRYSFRKLPRFPDFDEEREVRFRATEPGAVPKPEVRENLRLILEGKFDADHAPQAYAEAQKRAGVVPRERVPQPAGRRRAGP